MTHSRNAKTFEFALVIGLLGAGAAAAQGTLTYSYALPGGTAGAQSPSSPLTEVSGNFYGESAGGAKGIGAVYELSSTGVFSTLYSFPDGHAGKTPAGGLTYYNGKFYGVTVSGGSHDEGVLFSLTTTGVEHVIHDFSGGTTDGGAPNTQPILFNGGLYGTTQGGGPANAGTVYAISATGAETVVYAFAGGTDGYQPEGDLLAIGGTLYGTTSQQGCLSSTVCGGSLFALTPAGVETVLHRFDIANDGSDPLSNLLNIGGTIYGVADNAGPADCGTAYSFTPGVASSFTILHQFARSSTDACHPATGFAALGGTLYATSVLPDDGTIFAMSPAGTTGIDFSFTGTNGDEPQQTLLPVGRTLWGTTTYGGTGGIIFSLAP